MKVYFLTALLIAAPALADTTFICTGVDGRKAVQDQPCAADAAQRTVDTYRAPREQTAIHDSFEQIGKQAEESNKKIWCDYHRQMAEDDGKRSNAACDAIT